MKKAYVIFPLIALIVFGVFYIQFERGYEAKVAESKAVADLAKKELEQYVDGCERDLNAPPDMRKKKKA